jgi:hypothetical protein
MKQISLREIAYSRAGEKGKDSNVSVIVYDDRDYDLILNQITVEAVRALFGPITKGQILRYETPRISALNFVLENVLEGGRSRTLAFEESGKALSSLILTIAVNVPDDYMPNRTPKPVAVPPSAGRPDAKSVRIGTGTAWSRDRFEPAGELVKHGRLDYLCSDSMSEVTMSAAQVARMEQSSTPPYDPYLEERLRPILADCKKSGIRIISNQGWLDPVAAAERVIALGQSLGIKDLRVAAVSGSNLTDSIAGFDVCFIDTGEPVASRRADLVSAEAYLGIGGIVEALKAKADVIITTRVADGCLFLAPLAYEFGWSLDDYDQLAKGMVVGHLMECGAQVTGGNFVDPGYKDVPDLYNLGHPIIEVSEDRIILSKLPSAGGLVSEATCKEQLLYEVGDPANYLCPDVNVDLTKVSFRQHAPNEVEVIVDHAGKPKTSTLKALVGLREGFMTEEMVLFAGPGAYERAEVTKEVLTKRFERVALKADEIRMEYIGVNSVHREASPKDPPAYEAVLRIAAKAKERIEAEKIRREVDTLAVNGTSGTGKWATTAGARVRPVVGLSSVLVPRELVPFEVKLMSTEDLLRN